MDTDLALAVRTGNPDAAQRALAIVRDEQASNPKRAEMAQALADAGDRDLVPVMLGFFEKPGNPRFKEAILPVASKFDDPRLAQAVLDNYVRIFAVDARLRAAASRMLASRQAWAKLFLDRVELRATGLVGEGINGETKVMEPDVLRQLALYDDPDMKRIIHKQWPSEGVRPDTREHLAEIERIRKILTEPGDPGRGRELFTQRCSVCHTLFGQGGNIGPELTGYQRDNLNFWLTAIVEPSLEIREGFALYSATLNDGRTLVGMMVRQDAGGVVLRNLSGQLESAKVGQIKTLEASPVSLMPEGLLTGLPDTDLRALFAYLMKP
jgi:putative heme-binding domain-containing protein